MSNIKRYSPTTIGDSDDSQFMGMFEFDDGKYCAYEDVDDALAAKDARIAELEAERTEWVEAYWKTHHQSGHIKRSNHRGDSYAHQPAEPATHSEDGGEVPEVVGVVTASGMRRGVNEVVSRPALHDLRPGETLMTVAQHERIVGAYRVARIRARSKTPVMIDAQPACQVGGEGIEALRRQIDTLTEWYANGLNVIEECSSVLPGTHYMDPPDGGDVSIPEQLRRMAKDAERYRWVRDCGNGSYLYAMIRAGQCGRNMDDAIDEASKVLRKDQSHG